MLVLGCMSNGILDRSRRRRKVNRPRIRDEASTCRIEGDMAESSAHLNCRQTAARRIPELDGLVVRRRRERAAVGQHGS